MIKVLIIGDGVVPTGFSRVLHSIADNLPVEDYEIEWLAVNYRGDPHNYKYKIFPASTYTVGDIYGYNRLPGLLEDFKPDIIFLLNDPWILSNYLDAFKQIYDKKQRPKIVVYFPVDAKDHDSTWFKHFEIVDKVVVYTNFALDIVKKAAPNLEPVIIPHGVSTDIFYKLDTPKYDLKKSFYPKDREDFYSSFIVLNANRNQPRKRIDVSIHGFSLFARNKPENVKFYYHGGVVDSAVDVLKLAERYGISNRLIITSLHHGVQTIPDNKLNEIYNVTDVGINTSLGEGWGLCNVEHGSIGIPQVVPNHSACAELFADCGILMKADIPIVQDNICTTGYLTRAEYVAQALEILYQNKEVYFDLGKRCYDKFHSEQFSWKTIAQMWDKLFKEIL